jgi:hypothetical protein
MLSRNFLETKIIYNLFVVVEVTGVGQGINYGSIYLMIQARWAYAKTLRIGNVQ